MANFKIDLKSIKEKINYAEKLLNSNELSLYERERIKHTILAYYAILDSSDNIYNTTIRPFLDKITNGKYSERRESKLLCKTGELTLDKDDYGLLTKEYLEKLIKFSKEIEKPQVESTKFNSMEFSDEELKNIALAFFKSIDSEMLKSTDKILSTPSLINISDYRSANNIDGTTYYDYIASVPYIIISRNHTIEDAQVFVHELMHANDFLMQPKYFDSNYYGFHETPSYCCDLLFADFMELIGVNKDEVNKIRTERINYIRGLAHQALSQIRAKVGREKFGANDIDAIYNVIDESILKKLLEVESGIMAIGLYTQISHDKNHGVNNLKTFMKSLISKNETPNFSYIGLDDEALMSVCSNIKTHGCDLDNYNVEKDITPKVS